MLGHLVTYLLLLRWREMNRNGHGPLVLILVPVFGALLAWLTWGFFDGLARERDLLTVALAAWMGLVALVVAGTAAPAALRALYFNRDLELYLAAPVPPLPLFASRLVETFVSRALVWALAGFSCLAGGGVALGAPLGFHLFALTAVLLVALAACALAFMVALLLARFIPVRLLNRAITTVGTGVLTVGGLFLGFRYEALAQPELWLQGASGLAEHPIFAPGRMLVGALEGAWPSALAGLFGTALVAGGMVLAASRVFTATYRHGHDRMERAAARAAAPGSRSTGWKGIARALRRRLPEWGPAPADSVGAVAGQEWRHALRDPVLRSRNTLGLVFVATLPVYVVLGLEDREMPWDLRLWFLGGGLLVGGAILASVAGLSAFAREGRNIELLRSAPVPTSRLLAGKVLGVAAPVIGLLLAIQAPFWLVVGPSLLQAVVILVATVGIIGGLAVITVSLSALLAPFDGDDPGQPLGALGTLTAILASIAYLSAVLGLPLTPFLLLTRPGGIGTGSPFLLGGAMLHALVLGAVLVGFPVLVGRALRRLDRAPDPA